jgi:hypothetical protein
MTKTSKKKEGFTLNISPEIAHILGVQNQDDIRIIVKDNEVILKAKKTNPAHIEKQQAEKRKLTKRLIKQYEPVLKKLAKT